MIEISRGGSSDIPAVASIASIALPDPWPRQLFNEELRLAEARLWVARAGERTIGYLSARRIVDGLHILSVAVDPAWRRRGVARALLDAAVQAETARGARAALLEVRSSNSAARALYAGAGFVAVGRRPRYYANGEDAVLMTRRS